LAALILNGFLSARPIFLSNILVKSIDLLLWMSENGNNPSLPTLPIQEKPQQFPYFIEARDSEQKTAIRRDTVISANLPDQFEFDRLIL
jgi:hypothetical protein